MTPELIFTNGRIVTADAVFDGHVRVRNGEIVEIAPVPARADGAPGNRAAGTGVAEWIDLEGDYLIPGLVELHTDNLERNFAPRPGVAWPPGAAAYAHDAHLAAAGITTVFDALAVGDLNVDSGRIIHLHAMADAIRGGVADGRFRAEHFIHLRCELSYPGVMEPFEHLVDDALVRLVSVMDHTPGQRQFAEIDTYKRYYQGKYGLTDAQLDAFLTEQQQAHARYAEPHRARIVAACQTRGLPLASHDDATETHVMEAVEIGAKISEFPTTEHAAAAARSHGLKVLMGAPNVVLNGSHSGNVSAARLAALGLLDILSSDYVPTSLIHGAFLLARAGDADDPGGAGKTALPAAIALVSKNPASAAGLNDRGEIALGKRADFARVRDDGEVPMVAALWRAGRRVM